ncbi:MAG: hypothetical protein AAF850_08670 [Pseudomonadota bacterium]
MTKEYALSGAHVLRALKSNNGMQSLPIGVCTGSIDPYDRKHLRVLGADFLTVNPFGANASLDVRTQIQRRSEDRLISAS